MVDNVTGQDLPNYQFRHDQQIMMMFGHLEGFTISAGKAYPGVEMRIYDEQGQLVQNNADLMPGSAGGVKASTAECLVSARLTVSKQTFKPGKKYLRVVRVFDKKKLASADYPSLVQRALNQTVFSCSDPPSFIP